jgi:nucleotide-binding universal stress UspA family protein
MRIYLVVMDGSAEGGAALRYAARRAARTGAAVEIVTVIEPTEFVEWGGVQAAMEEEARLRAEAMVLGASGAIADEAGIQPKVTVRRGDPIGEVTALIRERRNAAALVLGAPAEGGPGPLVAHFAGPAAGTLPCPLIIVPEGLTPAPLGGEAA